MIKVLKKNEKRGKVISWVRHLRWDKQEKKRKKEDDAQFFALRRRGIKEIVVG